MQGYISSNRYIAYLENNLLYVIDNVSRDVWKFAGKDLVGKENTCERYSTAIIEMDRDGLGVPVPSWFFDVI